MPVGGDIGTLLRTKPSQRRLDAGTGVGCRFRSMQVLEHAAWEGMTDVILNIQWKPGEAMLITPVDDAIKIYLEHEAPGYRTKTYAIIIHPGVNEIIVTLEPDN